MQRQLTMLALHFAATLRRCFERAHLVVTLAVWMHWALNCMASAFTLLIHHICQTDEVCNARREPRLQLIAEMISNSDRHCDGKSRTKNTTMRNSRVNIENLCTVISVGDQLYGGFITPTQRASPTGHWPFNREIGSIGGFFPCMWLLSLCLVHHASAPTNCSKRAKRNMLLSCRTRRAAPL